MLGLINVQCKCDLYCTRNEAWDYAINSIFMGCFILSLVGLWQKRDRFGRTTSWNLGSGQWRRSYVPFYIFCWCMLFLSIYL
eukprot:UN03366